MRCGRSQSVLLEIASTPGHDVAEVAAAKVLYVALSERLALPVTAPRVRTESEVTHGRLGAQGFRVPVWSTRRGRPTCTFTMRGYFLPGAKSFGSISQPCSRVLRCPMKIAHLAHADFTLD